MKSRNMQFVDNNKQDMIYQCVVIPKPENVTISQVGTVTYKKWIASYLKHVKDKFGNIFPLCKTFYFDMEISKKI